MSNVQQLFDSLWNDYISQNPKAKSVFDVITAQGEVVINDHIALRTFDHPKIGIEKVAKPFIDVGYRHTEDYIFEEKRLVASHFAHPTEKDAPKVFISALEYKKFSPFLQSTVEDVISRIPENVVFTPAMLTAGCIWGSISYASYLKLKDESEYAGWLYSRGFRVNHFTVNINALKKLGDINTLNRFLMENGFPLNESGGLVKGSPAEFLEQSSTLAERSAVTFSDGSFDIPSCFYEFAKRYPDASGELFSGFIAKSADKIFESTNNAM